MYEQYRNEVGAQLAIC